jgi:hypothetical protein
VRIFVAATILGLLTGAAFAGAMDPLPGAFDTQQKVDEQGYRDAIKRIPDQKPANTDPWGTVRDSGTTNNQKKLPSQK